jgi:hypothetical protein
MVLDFFIIVNVFKKHVKITTRDCFYWLRIISANKFLQKGLGAGKYIKWNNFVKKEF